LLLTPDPLERLRLSVGAPTLSKSDRSNAVSDALAQLPPGAREAAAVYLFETGAVGHLHAATAEHAGEIYQRVIQAATFSETQHNSSSRFKTWKCIEGLLGQLDPADRRAHLCANAIAAAYAREELTRPEEADAAFAAWHDTDARLQGGRA